MQQPYLAIDLINTSNIVLCSLRWFNFGIIKANILVMPLSLSDSFFHFNRILAVILEKLGVNAS